MGKCREKLRGWQVRTVSEQDPILEVIRALEAALDRSDDLVISQLIKGALFDVRALKKPKPDKASELIQRLGYIAGDKTASKQDRLDYIETLVKMHFRGIE